MGMLPSGNSLKLEIVYQTNPVMLTCGRCQAIFGDGSHGCASMEALFEGEEMLEYRIWEGDAIIAKSPLALFAFCSGFKFRIVPETHDNGLPKGINEVLFCGATAYVLVYLEYQDGDEWHVIDKSRWKKREFEDFKVDVPSVHTDFWKAVTGELRLSPAEKEDRQ